MNQVGKYLNHAHTSLQKAKAVLWASIEAIGTFLDAILGVILCGILLVLQMSRTKYILMVVFAARLM